jgi:cytochrome c oxidase subunit 2
MTPAPFVPVLSSFLLAASHGPDFHQSALDAAGPQAARIETLYWIFSWVCVVVYVLVLLFLLIPFLFKRSPMTAESPSSAGEGVTDPPVTSPDPGAERRRQVVVSTLVGMTVIILFCLLIGDMVTGRAVHAMQAENPLTIKITGHQWWWEVTYQNWPPEFGERMPANMVSTANEIHLPTGRPVKFELNSPDVIHSLWIPNLHGKKDLVPGHPVNLWVQADKELTFTGQCAEFCGHQHANMRLVVVAERPEKFLGWLEAGRQPAREPVYEPQKRGKQVFMGRTCIMCHSIVGTDARGRVGPDLTHFASRPFIGAGAAPNNIGYLAGWIVDAQKMKPGCHMPQNPMPAEDLRDLLEYLEMLK